MDMKPENQDVNASVGMTKAGMIKSGQTIYWDSRHQVPEHKDGDQSEDAEMGEDEMAEEDE